jgi:hypothetical protein
MFHAPYLDRNIQRPDELYGAINGSLYVVALSRVRMEQAERGEPANCACA